jgi:hypothetical protein
MAERIKLYECKSVNRNSSEGENEAIKLIEEGFEYVCDINANNKALFRKKLIIS